MIDKRKARQLAAETIREMGVLVGVFAPLDAFFQTEPPALRPLGAIIVSALIAIVIGIIIEAGVMRESDWNFILHWVPSLGIAFILAIFALVLQALERRAKREGDSGTAGK